MTKTKYEQERDANVKAVQEVFKSFGISVSQQPTPTTSVNQAVPTDTSPGGQSSRQSNDINESAEQFDAANLEGHTYEGEPRDDLVPSKQYEFLSICFSIHYLQLLLL